MPLSCRIDIIDQLNASSVDGDTTFVGYGYRFSTQLSVAALDLFAKSASDENAQVYGYKSDVWVAPTVKMDSAYIAEVRYRAGVTDNEAASLSALFRYADARTGNQYWSNDIRVASGKIYLLSDTKFASKLYNPLIETVEILQLSKWLKNGFATEISVPELVDQPRSIEVSLDVDDAALIELSKRGIEYEGHFRGPLGLGLDDLYALRDYYQKLGRKITDIELETFAQSWSEHCKHRFFAAEIDDVSEGLFRRYIKSATDDILNEKPGFCLSVFHDNAGGIAFSDDFVVAFKVETHNSPSALDPYGGAMTGVLGVNRDCLGFGMGAEPIANVFGYCLPVRDDMRPLYRQSDQSNPIPIAPDLADGIIQGIEEGGNHSGIPTVQGFIYEDESFRGKPLVYCGTLGILPRQVMGPEGQQSSVEKSARAGDYIYVMGNHVGFDGIHGATFSSVELDDNSPATAVQIGDPITQKNLQDVLFKARDRGLYRAITDNGAGGLSSSIGEMAEGAGGAEVWLENVTLKYPGLAPWEIWISESQERMLASVPPEKADAFEALFAHYDVSVQRLGCFRDDGYLRLCYEGEELGTLEMSFLHEGDPKRFYSSKGALTITPQRTQEAPRIRELLELSNFQTRRSVFRRYDHEVQGKSVLKPLIGDVENMVSVVRPIWSRPQGVALSQAYMPYLTEADPFMAGYAAVDLCIRRMIAGGSNPDKLAILDNFCWSKPESSERLYQLKESARGLCEGALEYKAPIVSGKDSMYNDFRGYDENGNAIEVNALPTLLISGFGIVDDCNIVPSFDFKFAGDQIALYMPNASLLTRTQIDQARKDGGASQAGARGHHFESYQLISEQISKGQFASVEALAMGGIGFAVLRAALASGLGASVNLPSSLMDENLGAFCEFDSGFLVTAAPDVQLGNDYLVIGEVRAAGEVEINDDLISIEELKRLYFRGGYEGGHHAA